MNPHKPTIPPDPVHGLVLDHAGYAVRNIQECLDRVVVPLFAPARVGPVVADPLQKVRVCFVTLAGGGRLELIEPMSEDSPIAGLLAERRGGLYHCCFRTDALDETIKAMEGKGFVLASSPLPAAAYGGRRIAFLFSEAMGLTELVEA